MVKTIHTPSCHIKFAPWLQTSCTEFHFMATFYKVVINLCEWSVYNENTTKQGNIGNTKYQQNYNSKKIGQY